ncbi:MAG: hypothetical protein IIT93_00770 [Paludibacteraceae bacterium]|nr:hypothetical protein [Paludibacteraceae bacterium]
MALTVYKTIKNTRDSQIRTDVRKMILSEHVKPAEAVKQVAGKYGLTVQRIYGIIREG